MFSEMSRAPDQPQLERDGPLGAISANCSTCRVVRFSPFLWRFRNGGPQAIVAGPGCLFVPLRRNGLGRARSACQVPALVSLPRQAYAETISAC